jgi:hypothetical protein
MERVYSEGDEIMIIDSLVFVSPTLDTDETLSADSDSVVASQKATKAYVDDLQDAVTLDVVAGATSCTTGDGKAYYRVPSIHDGKNLVVVSAACITAGTTGTMDIQIANVTVGQDMLTTKMTIDSGETDTLTAATPAVISATYDEVSTGDIIRVDIDAIHSGTAAKGLIVEMQFKKP